MDKDDRYPDRPSDNPMVIFKDMMQQLPQPDKCSLCHAVMPPSLTRIRTYDAAIGMIKPCEDCIYLAIIHYAKSLHGK